jgi:metal-dependent amidase/aminoacylase/carboxypeptidase family protein
MIPDQAMLRLNVRSFKEAVRERVLAAIRRIVEAESAASDAPNLRRTPPRALRRQSLPDAVIERPPFVYRTCRIFEKFRRFNPAWRPIT